MRRSARWVLAASWVIEIELVLVATITSGAMIGRCGFVGDLLYSVGVTGFIYPIIGHWAWGPDGFLATMGSAGNFLPSLGMGFHDFAGSTVVHTIGGFIALAGSIVLGPRLGRKFKRDGGGPMMPHDLTIAVSGGLLLWFGWYGFNPGSTLSAMDFAGIGRVDGLDLPDSPGKAGNYLILGSDSRSFVKNQAQADAFGSSSDTGGNRSDTLMVVHIDPDAKKSLLVSIPRDTLVTIPPCKGPNGQQYGTWTTKFNAAFAIGGPACTVKTIKAETGIELESVAKCDGLPFTAEAIMDLVTQEVAA